MSSNTNLDTIGATVYLALDEKHNCIRFGKVNINKSLEQAKKNNYCRLEIFSFENYSMHDARNAIVKSLKSIGVIHAGDDRFKSPVGRINDHFDKIYTMIHSFGRCIECKKVIYQNYNVEGTVCPMCGCNNLMENY
jgi:hypothetical protein